MTKVYKLHYNIIVIYVHRYMLYIPVHKYIFFLSISLKLRNITDKSCFSNFENRMQILTFFLIFKNNFVFGLLVEN